MKRLYIIICFLLLSKFSLSQKLDVENLFNNQFIDSIGNFLIINQDDLILKIYIEIDPLSINFINCLNCKNNELEYLNVEKIKRTFYQYIDKNNCEDILKKYRYLIEINSIENINRVTQVG